MKIKNEKDRETHEKLTAARHGIGLYSLKEICIMFNCSRYSLDNAINLGELKYISPNNRDRYVYLSTYLEYLDKKGGK